MKDRSGVAACGPDNVKCIDYTGRYIDVATGAPIYSTEFFMLENSISLDGDALRSSVNVPYINMLNDMKGAASSSLDKCRDVADSVWDEYLRQTLVDLSQRQMSKIREVRDGCVKVINDCYDEKSGQLKQFAGDLAQNVTGVQQIELTEQMCYSKLESCALLYGVPPGPPGLQRLRDYVKGAQIAKVESNCEKALADYAKSMCSPVNDNLHGCPYQCRLYKVGTYTPNEDGNLYRKFRVKATEVCSLANDPSLLSNEVEMIIAKIVNDIKLKMDDLLSKECEKIDGAVWYSNTLAKYNRSANSYSEFTQKVGADPSWGVCQNSVECPANLYWTEDTLTEKEEVNKEKNLLLNHCKCGDKFRIIPYKDPKTNISSYMCSECPDNSSFDKNAKATSAGSPTTKAIPVEYCRCDKMGLVTSGKCPV
jgi:hypothetical protein